MIPPFRPLAEDERLFVFRQATSAFESWYAKEIVVGMTDTELEAALTQALGIFGGCCETWQPDICHHGAGLKIWGRLGITAHHRSTTFRREKDRGNGASCLPRFGPRQSAGRAVPMTGRRSVDDAAAIRDPHRPGRAGGAEGRRGSFHQPLHFPKRGGQGKRQVMIGVAFPAIARKYKTAAILKGPIHIVPAAPHIHVVDFWHPN